MLLTLEVIGASGDALGSARRKTIGAEGAQIGRSKECDWVINDPYISRVHARVRHVNGAFYIEGMGRNPLAINDPAHTVPNNEPQLLQNGDRFFLDQHEIKVSISAASSAGAGLSGDPFAVDSTAAVPRVPTSWGGAPMPGSAPLGDVFIQDGLIADADVRDPLAVLGGAPPPRHEPVKTIDLHQRSVLEDNYRPPTPMAPVSAPVPPLPTRAPPLAQGGAIPDSWDRTGMTQMEQPKPGAPIAEPAIRVPRPVASATMRRPAETLQPFGTAPAPLPDATVTLPPPPPAAEPRANRAGAGAGPVPAGAGGSVSLEELLRAAGLSGAQMSPELAAELGAVLRIVIQGLMEVLQSRAEIKSQLRMSMTRMQPTENNPLKFSPNVEAALHTLLVERNRGYLTTTRAFEEALLDIRNHQIAVLQGIRAAFDAMLEQFNPQRLEEEMNRHSRRSGGLLGGMGAKSRFRDFYVEQFEQMTKDPDESFKRLFGEYFAQAYEEQMDRLKMAGRTAGG